MTKSDRANDALAHYWEQREGTPLPNEELRDTVTDLLTDLRFLCRREHLDFAASVRMSEHHFEEESNE